MRRRPINHGPIADIHAGAHVPKCVYVSRQTPVMAAVKRVKKILREIERRAVQGALGAGGGGKRKGARPMGREVSGKELAQGIGKVNELLRREREEVLVKASGRAMEQALRVAEWFRSKEKDVLCDVVVRTGNVSVVDDIVEVDKESGDDEQQDKGLGPEDTELSKMDCGETTLELLGDETTSTIPQISSIGIQRQGEDMPTTTEEQSQPLQKSKKRKRKKKSKPIYDTGDVPEARLRWVKTVEVAISLKG